MPTQRPSIATLREELQISEEEKWERINALDRGDPFLSGNPNVNLQFLSDYAFECQVCKDLPLGASFYRISKGTLGGWLSNRTTEADIKTKKGIVRISNLETTPKFDSTLNYVVNVGYVCDHCKVSVFDESA